MFPTALPRAGASVRAFALLILLPALALAADVRVPETVTESHTSKTNAMKTGTLATSATTADQVVLTYTVTAGKTFYLAYMGVNGRLTTFAATATLFGACSLESPAGTKLVTTMLAGAGIGDRDWLPFIEPVPIAAGVVIRIVCTPAAATAMTWQANFGGFER
jgi:hypothetical protein